MNAALFKRLGLVLAALWWLAVPVNAAVPHEDAVPAYATEQSILQIEKDAPEPGWLSPLSGRSHTFRTTISSSIQEPGVILQRGGNTWRTWRNGPIAFWGGVLLLLVPTAILAFYSRKGTIRLHAPPTGRQIKRFSGWERLVHWVTAITFLILAFTGLLITYGKVTLLPLIGHDAFSVLAMVSKWAHNVSGPLFVVASVVMFFTFLRENFWKRYDWAWIRGAGGFVSGKHIPTGKFNAGSKLWYWGGVVFLGLLVSASGLVLDFVNFGQTRYIIQWANYVHMVAAILYIVASLGHIYIGTIGTEGAYQAMRRGTVDEQWAKEHHEYWYDDVMRTGRDQPGGQPPAGAVGAAARPLS